MSDSRKTRYERELIQSNHAAYVKRKKEEGTKEGLDKNMMQLGADWYNAGKNLEDADPKLQASSNFVNGYQRAGRIAKINAELYQSGREYFEKGVPLTEIPDQYLRSEQFMNGYSDSFGSCIKKSGPRR